VTGILPPDIWLLPLLEESAIFSLFIYNEVVSRIKTIWSGYEMNKFGIIAIIRLLSGIGLAYTITQEINQ